MILIEATTRYTGDRIIINIGKVECIMDEGEAGCTFVISPESGTIEVEESYDEIRNMLMTLEGEEN